MRRDAPFHGHYADAGSVALSLTRLLDTLLIQTGHSLGRVKQQRLAEQGHNPEELERRYHFSRRIGAEDAVLAAADLAGLLRASQPRRVSLEELSAN